MLLELLIAGSLASYRPTDKVLVNIKPEITAEQAPDIQPIEPVALEKLPTVAVIAKPRPKIITTNTAGNTYAPGYCTWYVANQLSWVPNGWGNANMWAIRASALGYTVNGTPRVGSVAQTSSYGLGHVAVVRAVYPNGTVLISEMNYNYLYDINQRITPASDWRYIHPN